MIIIRYIWYYFFWLIVRLGLSFFYKRIKISGIENVPKNVPVIFAANHENAFMDALIITTRTSRFSSYLVRADVFKKPFFAFILRSFNMLPVFRIRDGFSSLKSNQGVFEECFKVLAKNRPLIMFPEGQHDIRRIPRKVTKGISRIAIGAANSNVGPDKVYVVPVGLNYTDHKEFRSSVHVVYGEAVLVESQEENIENLDQLRQQINSGLLNCSIGLQKKYYEQLDALVFRSQSGYQLEPPDQINLKSDQIIHCFENKNTDGIFNALEELSKNLDELGIKFWTQVKSGKSWQMLFYLLLLTPFYLYGLIHNLVPIIIVSLIVGIKVSDEIFTASIKFSLGMFLFPIFWFLISLLVWDYSAPAYSTLIYCLSMPASLLVVNRYHDIISKYWALRHLENNREMRNEISQSIEYIENFKSAC